MIYYDNNDYLQDPQHCNTNPVREIDIRCLDSINKINAWNCSSFSLVSFFLLFYACHDKGKVLINSTYKFVVLLEDISAEYRSLPTVHRREKNNMYLLTHHWIDQIRSDRHGLRVGSTSSSLRNMYHDVNWW